MSIPTRNLKSHPKPLWASVSLALCAALAITAPCAYCQDQPPATSPPSQPQTPEVAPPTADAAQTPAPQPVAPQEVAPPPATPPSPRPPSATPSTAQQDPFLAPIPDTVEEAIQVAMERNPEVRMARAKLDQAQCELDMARVKATQDVMKLSAALKNCKEKYAAGLTPSEGLAQLEADLRAAIGIGTSVAASRPSISGPSTSANADLVRAERPPLPKPGETKIAEVLTAPVSLDFGNGPTPLSDILEFIGEYLDVSCVADVDVMNMEMGIHVENVPLTECLLAMTDRDPEICFVIRDYGIFATTPERAQTIVAPTIPDMPLYVERSAPRLPSAFPPALSRVLPSSAPEKR